MRRFFRWLERLSDESHRSERLAARWHGGHIVLYAVLIGAYVGGIAFHAAARQRHLRNAGGTPSERWKGA